VIPVPPSTLPRPRVALLGPVRDKHVELAGAAPARLEQKAWRRPTGENIGNEAKDSA